MPSDRLMAGPADIYVAPEGTAHSNALITGNPGSPWELLAGGWHSDDGITIGGTQSINLQRVQNETLPVDAFRGEETWTISMTMMDFRVEAFAWAVHGDDGSVATVAAASGTIGTKKIGLERGHSVNKLAVLVRGDTPYENGVKSNFYTPRAFVSSDFETTLMLGDAANIPIEFTILKHTSIDPFWIAQTAKALP